MTNRAAPCATYRLQFNRHFTFRHALAMVAYLERLGISHVYASPFLKARAGSTHGYDIVDHNALNPEIGSRQAFADYVAVLHDHGMGQILDIVPNHMGVGGDDNRWWLDVLENGEASHYAGYFDIDWHPANTALRNKVLLPFLDDHYGSVLEQAELRLALDPKRGSFGLHYGRHLFPIDPRTWPQIFEPGLDRLARLVGEHHPALLGVRSLITDCRALPRRTDLATARRQQRHREGAHCKQRLANLLAERPEVGDWLAGILVQLNGTAGRPRSFDALHHLLEAQAWRLACWRVAADDVNYRRFFDINSLAGMRMDDAHVFEATHGLVRRLVESGDVDGLRIDHPDGLSDPFKYFSDLEHCLDAAPGAGPRGRVWLLVEKILATGERLPEDWPVAGTTGYDAAQLINGLFVHPAAETELGHLYRRLTGTGTDFDELLYRRRKLVVGSILASELTVLANLASVIASADRRTRDFTYLGLRDALAEVVACFPVYRTYITRRRISDTDLRYIHLAIARAKQKSPAADIQIFDFIDGLLTLGGIPHYSARLQRQLVRFAMRFQQYTAPVMAKGLEDTVFYVYHRLVSLNDVGFDPRRFGIAIATFHRENRERLQRHPRSMIALSSHDSKRGEDVRARINVVSELPREWRRHVAVWRRANRRFKRLVDGSRAPDNNDEYLLYQTLLGSWPTGPLDESAMEAYTQRIQAYMQKAIKEAKVHTSWINPNGGYEAAVQAFVTAVLEYPFRNAFLADFVPFQQRLTRYGLMSGLSQTLLKLTMPGVPDIYQGNESWAFNLVDPDNRRPVDFAQMSARLDTLLDACRDGAARLDLVDDLMAHLEDGRAKLYLTWQALALRRAHPALFIDGEYLALDVEGQHADHACAFARRLDDELVLVVVSRWLARLSMTEEASRRRGRVWDQTRIPVPSPSPERFRNILTDEVVEPVATRVSARVNAADLFGHMPVALLVAE